MKIKFAKTPSLRLAYEASGPEDGEPLVLLHGWPDSPRTWDAVLPGLHDAGYWTVAPYLRGYGPSTFRDPILGRKRRRTGQPVAFAQDVIDLADRLKLRRFHYVGHDWGARTGYALAALFPERLRSMVAISVPFEPGKAEPPEVSSGAGLLVPVAALHQAGRGASSAKTRRPSGRLSGTHGARVAGMPRAS